MRCKLDIFLDISSENGIKINWILDFLHMVNSVKMAFWLKVQINGVDVVSEFNKVHNCSRLFIIC